jgi:hypothetical protein
MINIRIHFKGAYSYEYMPLKSWLAGIMAINVHNVYMHIFGVKLLTNVRIQVQLI